LQQDTVWKEREKKNLLTAGYSLKWQKEVACSRIQVEKKGSFEQETGCREKEFTDGCGLQQKEFAAGVYSSMLI
jgi:hypothetical protein